MSAKLGKMLMVLSFLLVAGTLHAGSITVSGDTTGDPTWNRPTEGTPPSYLSGTGTAVHYESWSFWVGSPGTYTFEIVQFPVISGLPATSATFDTFLFLYGTSFDPASPLTNVLVGNEVNPFTYNWSRIDYNLTASMQYFVIATGYYNETYDIYSGFGPYSLNLRGPGDINLGEVAPVPEPSTMLLLGSGLAGLVGYGRMRIRK